ncbi:hypothetical protein FA13DRAFT_1735514 [Coprinellus micaceus]|uniref:MYND-type domain-containing protein n=1 Tax=Coprinellus micaceus TaxID=71717 RepID=A0A4Y7T3J0_COPMI|nr:hypothetical protein FA13DRAFT_1735514 [Coprinellus micaceus]
MAVTEGKCKLSDVYNKCIFGTDKRLSIPKRPPTRIPSGHRLKRMAPTRTATNVLEALAETKPHIMDLPESVPRLLDLQKRIQERYSLRQLEELLQFFKVPIQHDVDHQCAAVLPCLAALQDVVAACNSSSMAAPTAKRISSALDDIIYWMCIAMRVPFDGGDRVPQDTSWMMDVSHNYAIHSASTVFLAKLALFDEGILQKLASDPLILDLCVMWNVVTRGGAPLLYPAGYSTTKGQGYEPITGLTTLILKKNYTGLAAALQSRAVCDPELFFTRAAQRMDLLGRLNTLPHLSHLPAINVEAFNVSQVIAMTNSLVHTEPDLAKTMLETGAPGKFIEALAKAAYRYSLSDTLTPTVRTTCLERTLFYAKLVVAWSTLRPEFYLPTMKDLIAKGVIHLLGNCLNITGTTPSLGEGIGQEEWSEQFEALVHNILPWATSPELVNPLRSAVALCITAKKLQVMDANPERKHIVSRVVTIVDRYALYSDRERRVQVCDNLNHIARETGAKARRFVEKMCAGCHLLVYCSRECQREDWEARHRDECSDMRENYLWQKYTLGARYSHNSRTFHSTIFGNVFTTRVDVFNGIKARLPNTSPEGIERDPGWKVVYTIDPGDTIEPMSIDLLPDFVKATITLLPLYLKKRFEHLVNRLVSSSSPGSSERSRTMCMVNASYDTGRGYEANIIALLRNEKVGTYPGDPFPSFDIEASMVFTCPVRDRYGGHGGMSGHQQRNFEVLFGPGAWAEALKCNVPYFS